MNPTLYLITFTARNRIVQQQVRAQSAGQAVVLLKKRRAEKGAVTGKVWGVRQV